MANARKLSRLITGAAALLLVVSLASASWAQVPKQWEEPQKERATLEETDPDALARVAAATDRGVGRMGLGELNVYLYNFGLYAGRVFSTGSYYMRAMDGSNQRFVSFVSPAFGMDEGPWGNAQVFESSPIHGTSQVDWEAVDGARGLHFSDPPVTTSGYPIFATSDQTDTWPATGWPAPTGVTEVWYGSETWDKWASVGDRQSYAVYSDAYAGRDNTGQSRPVGIGVKQRAISYSGFNTIWIQSEFTNTGSYNLTGVYIGTIGDPYTPTNGSYDGWATIIFDDDRQLVWVRSRNYTEDTGYQYDGLTNTIQRSFVGQMVVESPTGNFRRDPATEDYIGDPTNTLTRVALIWNSDRIVLEDGEPTLYGALSGRVDLMSSNQSPIWKAEYNANVPILKQHQVDYETYYPGWDVSGGDPYWYMASGPVDMPAGSSLDFTVAVVGAYSQIELLEVADKAINSYNAKFAGPSPPTRPADFKANGILTGPHHREYDYRLHDYKIYYVPSGPITLSWDLTSALGTPDPLSGAYDFEGIRLYKSANRGGSWGTRITNELGQNKAWVPYRTWDLDNGITGQDPLQSWVSLGTDSGLVSKFTDTAVEEGDEYWYTLTAYDKGEVDAFGEPTLRSLESIAGSNPAYPAMIGVIAGTSPAGYQPGAAPVTSNRFYADWPGSSDATCTVNIIDDTAIQDMDYRVTAVWGANYAGVNYPGYYGIMLENLTTADTLYSGLLPEYSDIGLDLLPPTEGFQLSVGTDYNLDTSISDRKSYSFPSKFPCRSGDQNDFGDAFLGGTYLYDSDDMTHLAENFFPAEIRFSTTDTQMAYVYTRGGTPNYAYRGFGGFPGTVWDTTDPANPRQVNVAFTVPSTRPAGDLRFAPTTSTSSYAYMYILASDYADTADAYYTANRFNGITGTPMDPIWASWALLSSAWTDSVAAHPTFTAGQFLDGLTASYLYRKPLKPGGTYEFSTTEAAIDEEAIDMDDIKVVPNPYYILAEWDQTINRRKIQFTNVPANSTIDIYTVSGELVASLDHHGDANAPVGSKGYNSNRVGVVEWNIWTYEYTEAAFGLYVFVCKTDDGQKKVGKFAIIR